MKRAAFALAVMCVAAALGSPSSAMRAMAPRPFTLQASGDLVLNPSALASVLSDPGGYDALLEGYAQQLEARSLAYLNLEHPLVNDQRELDGGSPVADRRGPRRAPVLGATPELADALHRAGVDVVGLANNHAFDQRNVGMRRTMQELNRVGVPYAGAGLSVEGSYAPMWLHHGARRVVPAGEAVAYAPRLRVAFFSVAEAFNRRASDEPHAYVAHLHDEERLFEAMRNARSHADVMIVAVHWMRDFATQPGRGRRALAQQLVDAGADIVLGTGPHVLLPVERLQSERGDAVVAYSLGNIASGMGRRYREGRRYRGDVTHPALVLPTGRDGVVLRVRMRVRQGVRLMSMRATPMWTENNYRQHRDEGVPHRIRVVPLRQVSQPLRDQRFDAISRALGPEVTFDPPPRDDDPLAGLDI